MQNTAVLSPQPLAKDSDAPPDPDFTREELALLDAVEERYEKQPEGFISLRDFKAGKRI